MPPPKFLSKIFSLSTQWYKLLESLRSLEYWKIPRPLSVNLGGKVNNIKNVNQQCKSSERDMVKDFFSKKERTENDLKYTLDLIKKYDVIKQCYKKADHFISLASSSLNVFESSEQKNILKNLTSFSIERSF